MKAIVATPNDDGLGMFRPFDVNAYNQNIDRIREASRSGIPYPEMPDPALLESMLRTWAPSEDVVPFVFSPGRGVLTEDEPPVPGAVESITPDEFALRQRYAESAFNDRAVSKAGAKGAFQIMPSVLSDYINATGKRGDLFDYEYNKAVRDWYVDWLMNRKAIAAEQSEENKWAKLAAAYNWGIGNLGNYLQKLKDRGVDIYNSTDWVEGLNPETRDYVKFVALQQDLAGPRTTEAYRNALKRHNIAAEGGRIRTLAERLMNAGYYSDGGTIHIDPSKRGTFKAQATKMGMGVKEAAHHILAHKDNYSPAMVKKANFAANFADKGGALLHPYNEFEGGGDKGGDRGGFLRNMAYSNMVAEGIDPLAAQQYLDGDIEGGIKTDTEASRRNAKIAAGTLGAVAGFGAAPTVFTTMMNPLAAKTAAGALASTALDSYGFVSGVKGLSNAANKVAHGDFKWLDVPQTLLDMTVAIPGSSTISNVNNIAAMPKAAMGYAMDAAVAATRGLAKTPMGKRAAEVAMRQSAEPTRRIKPLLFGNYESKGLSDNIGFILTGNRKYANFGDEPYTGFFYSSNHGPREDTVDFMKKIAQDGTDMIGAYLYGNKIHPSLAKYIPDADYGVHTNFVNKYYKNKNIPVYEVGKTITNFPSRMVTLEDGSIAGIPLSFPLSKGKTVGLYSNFPSKSPHFKVNVTGHIGIPTTVNGKPGAYEQDIWKYLPKDISKRWSGDLMDYEKFNNVEKFFNNLGTHFLDAAGTPIITRTTPEELRLPSPEAMSYISGGLYSHGGILSERRNNFAGGGDVIGAESPDASQVEPIASVPVLNVDMSIPKPAELHELPDRVVEESVEPVPVYGGPARDVVITTPGGSGYIPSSPRSFTSPSELSGNEVKDWQSYLVGLGYDVGATGVDGIFGRNTTRAYQKYMSDMGMDIGSHGVDGIFGKDTRAASSVVSDVIKNAMPQPVASQQDSVQAKDAALKSFIPETPDASSSRTLLQNVPPVETNTVQTDEPEEQVVDKSGITDRGGGYEMFSPVVSNDVEYVEDSPTTEEKISNAGQLYNSRYDNFVLPNGIDLSNIHVDDEKDLAEDFIYHDPEEYKSRVTFGSKNEAVSRAREIVSGKGKDGGNETRCSAFVQWSVLDAYGADFKNYNGMNGDAWMIGKNMVDAGGQRYFNVFTEVDGKKPWIDMLKKRTKVHSDDKIYDIDYRMVSDTMFNYAKREFNRNKTRNIKNIMENVSAGDVIELMYYGSDQSVNALKDSGGKRANTHVGYICNIDGEYYVQDNVHGNVHTRKLMDVLEGKEKGVFIAGLVKPESMINSRSQRDVSSFGRSATRMENFGVWKNGDKGSRYYRLDNDYAYRAMGSLYNNKEKLSEQLELTPEEYNMLAGVVHCVAFKEGRNGELGNNGRVLTKNGAALRRQYGDFLSDYHQKGREVWYDLERSAAALAGRASGYLLNEVKPSFSPSLGVNQLKFEGPDSPLNDAQRDSLGSDVRQAIYNSQPESSAVGSMMAVANNYKEIMKAFDDYGVPEKYRTEENLVKLVSKSYNEGTSMAVLTLANASRKAASDPDKADSIYDDAFERMLASGHMSKKGTYVPNYGSDAYDLYKMHKYKLFTSEDIDAYNSAKEDAFEATANRIKEMAINYDLMPAIQTLIQNMPIRAAKRFGAAAAANKDNVEAYRNGLFNVKADRGRDTLAAMAYKKSFKKAVKKSGS